MEVNQTQDLAERAVKEPSAEPVSKESAATNAKLTELTVPVKPRKTRTRLGCFTCRKRHMKCPGQFPVCSNCHKRRLVCQFPESVSLSYRSNNAATAIVAAATVESERLEAAYQLQAFRTMGDRPPRPPQNYYGQGPPSLRAPPYNATMGSPQINHSDLSTFAQQNPYSASYPYPGMAAPGAVERHPPPPLPVMSTTPGVYNDPYKPWYWRYYSNNEFYTRKMPEYYWPHESYRNGYYNPYLYQRPPEYNENHIPYSQDPYELKPIQNNQNIPSTNDSENNTNNDYNNSSNNDFSIKPLEKVEIAIPPAKPWSNQNTEDTEKRQILKIDNLID